MKGIFIDPDEQRVYKVDLGKGELKDFYKLLDCDLIDRVSYNDKNDLVVDDEGLFKGHKVFYSILGVPGQFVGKSVIVDVDFEKGDWTDPIDLDEPVLVQFYIPVTEEKSNDELPDQQ